MRRRIEGPGFAKRLVWLVLADTTSMQETHVNVLGQQLVRDAVLVNDVVVESSSAQDGAGEESKDTVFEHHVSHVTRRSLVVHSGQLEEGASKAI